MTSANLNGTYDIISGSKVVGRIERRIVYNADGKVCGKLQGYVMMGGDGDLRGIGRVSGESLLIYSENPCFALRLYTLMPASPSATTASERQ